MRKILRKAKITVYANPVKIVKKHQNRLDLVNSAKFGNPRDKKAGAVEKNKAKIRAKELPLLKGARKTLENGMKKTPILKK